MANVLFSKEEALIGFTARRACALLFLIERRTTHLAAQASQIREIPSSETVARDRDRAFFESFHQSRHPPLRPAIKTSNGMPRNGPGSSRTILSDKVESGYEH